MLSFSCFFQAACLNIFLKETNGRILSISCRRRFWVLYSLIDIVLDDIIIDHFRLGGLFPITDQAISGAIIRDGLIMTPGDIH